MMYFDTTVYFMPMWENCSIAVNLDFQFVLVYFRLDSKF